MATIAKLDVLLGLKGDAFDKGLANSRAKLDSWGASLRSTGTKLTAGVTVPLIGLGVAALNSASSLDQAQGKVDAVFKDSAGVIKDWSTTTTNAFGISQTAALQSAGTMGNFFTSANIATEQSAEYSMQLVELSGDMAAFNDVSASRATEAIISGMAGEYDSLQRLGVNITAAKVETEALAIATADGRTEITEADLALARYNVIMEESKNQHGQAAREYDNYSSKLARMRARISDLAAKWGNVLMPVALDFLGVLEKLLGWVENLSPSMQRWAIIIAAAAAALGPLLIALGLMLPGLSLLLGIVGALLSPIGLLVAAAALLAYTFRDELGAALDWVVDKVSEFTDVFKEMRSAGLDPAQAALIALAAVFPQLGSVIAPLRQMVEHLGDAFQAFRDGNYGEAFRNIAIAAGDLGEAIWEAIKSAAAWVGEQVLKIPEIAVNVAGWLVDNIPDAWDWLRTHVLNKKTAVKLGSVAVNVASWVAGTIASVWAFLTGHVMGGNKGDGTGGATDPGFGGVTIASVVLSVLAWAKGAIPDAVAKVKSWVGDVTVSLASVALSILAFNPSYDGTAVDKLIEAMIGELLVTLSGVALKVVSFDPSSEGLTSLAQAAVAPLVAGLVLSAIPISVPVLLTLGVITLGLLFSFAVWQWAADWARANPVDAVEVLVNIALTLGKITADLPSKSELVEWVINKVLGATGSPLQVDIPAIIKVVTGDNKAEASATNGATDVNTNPMSGGLSPFGGGGGGMDIMELGGGGIQGIAELKESIASALDDIKTGTIQPKVAEWGAALQAGLAPMAGIATTSFGAVRVSAVTQLGMASASVAANTGQMTATSTANLGAMAGSAASTLAGMLGNTTANFIGIRSAGVSNTQQMGVSVAASAATMASNVGTSMGNMASRAVSSANQMRSGTVSAAQSAGAGISLAIASGTNNAVSAAGSNFGRLSGVISSAGSGAVGTASSLGSNIGAALAGGLDSMYGAVAAAASRLAAAAADAMAAALQVASPSRIGIWLGEMTGEGLRIGLDRMVGDVARSGDRLGEAAIPDLSRVSSALNGAGASGAGGRGEVKQYFFALTSDEFKALLAKAERGSAFAEGFADELGMRGGQG